MKQIKLKTGVVITANQDEDIISMTTPYYKDAFKKTVLRHYVDEIKKIIEN